MKKQSISAIETMLAFMSMGSVSWFVVNAYILSDAPAIKQAVCEQRMWMLAVIFTISLVGYTSRGNCHSSSN